MQKEERPKSVSVMATLLLIECTFFLLVVFRSNLLDTMKDASFFGVYLLIGSLCGFVMGIAMFKGFNWGRVLLLWATPVIIVIGLICFEPFRWYLSIIDGIGYLIFLFFLMQPNVLKYFGVEKKEVTALEY